MATLIGSWIMKGELLKYLSTHKSFLLFSNALLWKALSATSRCKYACELSVNCPLHLPSLYIYCDTNVNLSCSLLRNNHSKLCWIFCIMHLCCIYMTKCVLLYVKFHFSSDGSLLRCAIN